MSSFSDFKLPQCLNETIALKGWEAPTPIQEQVIPEALKGRDVLGGAATGTGKSAAFLIPLISRLADGEGEGVRALILEPSRELASQVCREAKDLAGRTALGCGAVIGGAGREEQQREICAITVATPGRLGEFVRKGIIDPDTVEVLVIDEADRMLDMGFRDEVTAIAQSCRNRAQTMLFSATLEGRGITGFAKELLNDPFTAMLSGDDEGARLPPQLQLRAYYAAGDEQKFRILVQLLTTSKGRSIVFVKTRERTGKVFSALKRNGFSCASLEGDMGQSEREAAVKRFREGGCDVLVATDVAARGLDLPDVRYVYNFDVPSNAAILTHRAGRTARAGAAGAAILLVTGEQLSFVASVENYTGREVEKRHIKNVCAEFPDPQALEHHQSEKKRKRASQGGHGGFDRRGKRDADEDKTHVKVRLRDKKNKGKPDFAAKRRKKEQQAQERAARAPEPAEPQA